MSARGRRKARHPRVPVELGNVDDVAALVLKLGRDGCPRCGAPAEFRPGPMGVCVALDHRPDCAELTDPGHLTRTLEPEEDADV